MATTTYYCARCLTTFTSDSDSCPNLTCGAPRPSSGWGVILGPGDMLDRHYRIERPLAVGGAGITYLAREIDASGTPIPPDLAIKVLYAARASGPFLRRLSNEAQILQELNHANIVECRGFVHRTGQEPYLVTLFEHGGSLTQHIERVGPVSPRIAADITRQVLRALDVAHQAGVVHRDLKPDNILLGTQVDAGHIPEIRLTDFGIAKISGGLTSKLTKIGTFVGTPEFAAPEQFQGLSPTPATDVFSAGAVLYYLLVGRSPLQFSHRNDIQQSYEELLDQVPPVLSAEVVASEVDNLTLATLQDCLSNMMVARPEHRWTIQKVLQQINPIAEGHSQLKPRQGTLELTDQGAAPRANRPSGARQPMVTFSMDEPQESPELVPPANTPAPAPPKAEPVPEPPPPAPEPEPEVAHHEAGGGGGAAAVGAFAGLAGLVMVGGGALLVLALLGGVGFYLMQGPGEVDTSSASSLLGASSSKSVKLRNDSLDALRELRPAIAANCPQRGLFAATVYIDAAGTIVQVDADSGYDLAPECVESTLTGRSLEGVQPGKLVRVRTAMRVK